MGAQYADPVRPRPLLLDLFCGAGGAAMGYHRAGFDVFGVDINPQKNYPFAFLQADAMEILKDAEDFHLRFAAVHASPPCQRYSLATPHDRRHLHPDLLGPIRARLEATSVPWVIENVPGAPIRADWSICGCQVGLKLRRRRLFETSWHDFAMVSPCDHSDGPVVSVVGHGTPSWTRARLGYNPTIQQYREAMGIDWMNRNELSEAIPPAYTELIGRRLLERLAVAA